MTPSFTLTLSGYYLWCPAPFVLRGKTYLMVSAWPVAASFEGWRTASRLFLYELSRQNGGVEVNQRAEIQLEGHTYGSLINPRVVCVDGEAHLFLSGVRGDGESYEIAYAPLGGLKSTSYPLRSDIVACRHDSQTGQGATNPAPVVCSDGKWRMLYRDSLGIGKKRAIYAAQANAPWGQWESLGEGPVIDGDIEDPFVWQSGQTTHCLIRDIDGTVTGKGWASIGMMQSDDWREWHPSSCRHVSDRGVSLADGSFAVMHRLERPALLQLDDGKSMLFFATLDSPDGQAAIRAFYWPQDLNQ